MVRRNRDGRNQTSADWRGCVTIGVPKCLFRRPDGRALARFLASTPRLWGKVVWAMLSPLRLSSERLQYEIDCLMRTI